MLAVIDAGPADSDADARSGPQVNPGTRDGLMHGPREALGQLCGSAVSVTALDEDSELITAESRDQVAVANQ